MSCAKCQPDPKPQFAEVRISEPPVMLLAPSAEVPADARAKRQIGIELPSSVRLSVDGAFDAEALSRVISVPTRRLRSLHRRRYSRASSDMRKGFDGLAVLMQQVLQEKPHSGALFAFRGRLS